MSTKVNIPSFLQNLTNGATVAEVDGSTVGECLQHLVEQFPGIEKKLFDKNGALLPHFGVRVNTHPAALARQVKDGDELYVFVMAIGGG